MPADTKRHREQRHAAFLVRSGTAVRRRLTSAEQVELLKAIDSKQLSAFGVRTLCHLELNNSTLPAPQAVGWTTTLSLLDYAGWRRRGHIILALLRGGADPGITAGGGGGVP